MMKIRIPSDVVVCVLSFLDAGTRIEANKPKITTFFHEISKKKKFKKLFKDFVFDNNSVSPDCKWVDNALTNLYMAGMLSLIDLKEYEITDNLTHTKTIDLFDKKEIKLLKEIALEFEVGQNEFKVYKPSWHKRA